ncbi:MAG: DUF721 domain-containing protein [Firmicutes bacterium]|nr:DUF721 domain-containing protein [Bacillota bacterium]
MQPGRIENSLKNILKKLNLFDSYKRHKALTVWERVCGSKIAALSIAKKLTGDKLHIAVRDHIWANEMSLREYEFLKRYEKILGRGVVNKIYFRAEPTEFGKKKKQKNGEDDYSIDSLELGEKDKEKVESALIGLTDEKTIELARKILTRNLLYEKWILEHGGVRCFHCGVAIEKNLTFCPVCVRELEKRNASLLKKELENRPWLSFSEAIKTVNPITYSLYCDVKSSIIADAEDSIDRLMTPPENQRDISALKLEIITLAMLLSEKPPSQLKDEVVIETLPGWMYQIYKA